MSVTHTSPATHVRTKPTAHAEPIHILVADDDHNDHLLLVMAAEAAGINAAMEFVDDGSELLLRLAAADSVTELPDLIVLDLRMPGMDGHRTLSVLQDHPVLWQIPVVVFTSSTRISDEVRSYDRGARWVDHKPSDFDGMVEFATSLVERARSTPYRPEVIDESDALDTALAALRADTIADTEDELLFRPINLDGAAS